MRTSITGVSEDVQDGWRTDQGHMYIVLGPPKQITTYPLARNVRPIEIWFYEEPPEPRTAALFLPAVL